MLMPFIHSPVGEAEMETMPGLRLIATRSTGYDHVDLAAAKERGVANVPAYGENTVAEHTFALTLTLSRKGHQAWVRTQRGDHSLEGSRGFDLTGKTLGVVGAGAIELHAIRIGKGFGTDVLAFDVRRDRLISEVLGFEYADLDDLPARSDVVSLHTPSNPATHHLINRGTLKKMKRGSLLVNTARGSLVDTEALTWALDEGIIAGAGLAVLEGEELLVHEDYLLGRGTEEQLRTLMCNHALKRRRGSDAAHRLQLGGGPQTHPGRHRRERALLPRGHPKTRWTPDGRHAAAAPKLRHHPGGGRCSANLAGRREARCRRPVPAS